MSDAQDREAPETQGRTAAEWATLGLSLAILAVALAAITWLEFGSDSGPTTIVASAVTDEIRQEGDVWYLPIEVSNEGDRTAEDVVIEAELDAGGGEPQTAEITFGFLASAETARGTVIFTSDPAGGQLTVRPVSFKEP